MDDIKSSRDRKRGHFPLQQELKTFLMLVLSHYADSSSRVWGLTSDFLKLCLVIWQNNSGWICVRMQFPSWTSSFLPLYSLKGSISACLSVLVSACRIQTYCLSTRITHMEQVVSAEGRGVGEMEGALGSLNKLLSVYLIYEAIRSGECWQKSNFSCCEAS